MIFLSSQFCYPVPIPFLVFSARIRGLIFELHRMIPSQSRFWPLRFVENRLVQMRGNGSSKPSLPFVRTGDSFTSAKRTPPFFFGRHKAIDQLVGSISGSSFLAMVGASGSGKSSVVRAGLVPALRLSHDSIWEIVALVPGDRPLRSLAAALAPLLEPEMTETDRLVEINKLSGALASGDLKLRDIVERILSKQHGTDRLLVVVDQWEELYSLTEDETTRRRFFNDLLEASDHVPVSLVLTLSGIIERDVIWK